MKKSGKLIAVFCALASLSVSATDLRWLISEFPPSRIGQGQYAGKGYFDRVDADIQSKLSAYNFQIENANWHRYQQMMRKGLSFCTSDLLENDKRSRYMHFSKPIFPLLPNGVIIRRNDPRFERYINEAGEIDLAALLQEPSLVPAIGKGRVYQGIIDTLINRYKGTSNHWYYAELSVSTVHMLNEKRVDYALDFPSSAHYLIRNFSLDLAIRYVPIKGMDKLAFAVVSCLKDEQGSDLIAAVNQLFAQQGKRYYLPVYMEWLPQSSQQYYLQLLKGY